MIENLQKQLSQALEAEKHAWSHRLDGTGRQEQENERGAIDEETEALAKEERARLAAEQREQLEKYAAFIFMCSSLLLFAVALRCCSSL